MKGIPRRVFTEEFKHEAIKLVNDQGLALAEASRKLDIASKSLRTWIRQQERGELRASLGASSQYCRGTYRALQVSYGMKTSMSRKGNCWDNAPKGWPRAMESFFGTLKTECLHYYRFTTRTLDDGEDFGHRIAADDLRRDADLFAHRARRRLAILERVEERVEGVSQRGLSNSNISHSCLA